MRLVHVRIEGVTPLLMHRFGEAAEGDANAGTRPNNAGEKLLPRDVAESVSYRDNKGLLYFPGASIMRLLREAGAGHKIKGSRKAVKFVVPSAVLVLTDAMPMLKPGNGERLKDFEVDSRPVVIPSTRGRVMRHRPRLDAWSTTFDLRVNEQVLVPSFVQQLLTEGGERLGIGDFRPEKGGPFGTFHVTEWKVDN